MTTFPPIINAFSTRPNVQQDSGDEYISDPRSERTMFLPSFVSFSLSCRTFAHDRFQGSFKLYPTTST
ncbi:hypothetical protein M404DRAFT_678584 [Pisolithus tinctorius Marx 270]|uniref:Uncharacterized protein n=1 Tax=Pisolithus tinctorius Marx 270 TaxID=870435 RepID=A0A0C3PF37_PISTI|nr:hypothetical protein M404DRAFT_678584 [Pisolithus tinctorius Marx 270]